MARRAVPGIFCVEGGWSSRLDDESSVRPLLEFLRDRGKVRFTLDEVHSLDALETVVRKWPQARYARYSLGYFGFHGQPGCLRLGRRKITLEELGEHLAGACAGKTIYFGSCSVLDIPTRRIQEFRRITKARCVAGYKSDVEWFESAAFDLLLFDALTHYKRLDAVERYLRKEQSSLSRRLGFCMYYG